jgi:hypothetical protein
MPRSVSAMLLSSFFAAGSAHAEDAMLDLQSEEKLLSERTDARKIEILSSFGFTESITTGVQPFGFGTGISAGYTFSFPLHLYARGMRFMGSRASAIGPGSSYSARYFAWSLELFAAWSWNPRPLPWLLLRPGLAVSTALTLGSTQVGTARIDTPNGLFSLGPKLAILTAPSHGFLLGIEGEARAIPTRLYAPIGAVAIVTGATF